MKSNSKPLMLIVLIAITFFPINIEASNDDPVIEVTISELVENSEKYRGKVVQLTGKCTKVNEAIMGKNWIHLKDGTKDDYDLVITSKESVKEGDKITIQAVVVLNKDFGAGYFYDLILENGKLIK